MGFRRELKDTATPKVLAVFSIAFSIVYGLIAVCVDVILLPISFTVSFISDKNFTFMALRRVSRSSREFDKKHKLWDYK